MTSYHSYRGRVKEFGTIDDIDYRLEKLDRERDVSQAVEITDSVLSGIGLFLGLAFSPWWLFVAAVPSFFLFVHGMSGWSPSAFLYHCVLGVRTRSEIDDERCELKSIRSQLLTTRTREHVTGERGSEVYTGGAMGSIH
jgi:hypothetical protein